MFSIKVNPSSALGALNAFEQKQLPYAVSLALNRTANLAQQAERAHIRKTMALRREDFILRAIKIAKTDRANRNTWTVIISIDQRADFLVRMESGEDHIPRGKWLFKPNADVFHGKIISRNNQLNPKNLQFDSAGRGPSRTFMVKRPGKGPLIIQRTSALTGRNHTTQTRDRGRFGSQQAAPSRPKRSRKPGTRMLYQMVSRSKVPVKLEFDSTIRAEAARAFPSEMRAALGEAMRSAR